MGCGIFNSRNQPVVYINEFKPPLHTLKESSMQIEVYPPQGQIVKEEGVFFSDREHIKQSQIVHIDQVSIFKAEYINGLDVTYFIDNQRKKITHCQSGGQAYKIDLEPTEHIQLISVTHDGTNICSIFFQSTKQKLEVAGEKGKGEFSMEVDLRQQKRAVIAFQGQFQETLMALEVYSWKLARVS